MRLGGGIVGIFGKAFVRVLTISILALGASLAHADEGMWLFNQLPTDALQTKYNFTPTADWVDHLMKSSVRISDGGSASFISSTGLVLTNHHVASAALQRVSTPNKDYLKVGFYAKTLAEEISVPGLALDRVEDITDVSAEVLAAVKPGMTDEEGFKAKRAAIGAIEKSSLAKTGLKSDVVTFYGGAQFQLYRYKRYTDVRIVFAPEASIAFFGGDPDNFEFPRYDFDMAVFRVYENGKPALTPNFLKFAATGVSENDLIFVSGNPGSTERLLTMAGLKTQKNLRVPYVLRLLRHREQSLIDFGKLGAEQERQMKEELFSVQNSLKAYRGRYKGLQDPELLANKQIDEIRLRTTAAKTTSLKEYVSGFTEMEKAEAKYRKLFLPLNLLETGQAVNSPLFGIARTIVRLIAEDQKPDSDRLAEYHEANRKSLELGLYSDEPIYPEFEKAKIKASLEFMLDQLDENDPLAQQFLAGKRPSERAEELIATTKLTDVSERKKIVTGGVAALNEAKKTDQLLCLADAIDAEARAVRSDYEKNVSEVRQKANAKILKIIFAVKGSTTYPDATFTPRLAFGTVKGYQESGKQIPAWTTMGGAYQHESENRNVEPYKLPESWTNAKSSLDLATPFNFVATADIIGGNSGSPVVNRNGELVGLIFDGNIQSLVLDYGYSETEARAVSVDVRAIIEGLSKIYQVSGMLEEIGK